MEDQEYTILNKALNTYFFNGRFEMLPVYLDLEGDAGEQVAAALDIDLDELRDFIGLTAARSLSFDKPDPYSDHAAWMHEWSLNERREPPPFTVLLCALSIAAERMGADENFSANNYYERLFELLGIKNTSTQQKLRQHAKSTRYLWRALNMWLSEKDFLCGRPTAKAVIPHWQYASFALSQALVRDADRNRFARLFETYDLAPGTSVPATEMMILLNDWMTKHGSRGPTAWLRKLWSVGDLRNRVLSAALDALEDWEHGYVKDTTGSQAAQLRWQLGFSGFPSKKARLSLSVTRGGRAEVLQPSVLDGKAALFLEEGFEPGVQFLAPIEAINLDALLLKSTTFVGAESGTSYAYIAKPIIPLARSPDGPSYQEVSRVSLFEEHAILCHEAWLERVEGYLSKCARPGYVVLRASDMRGIPDKWCILRGVEIVRPVDNAHDNFHALNPIVGTTAISCVGGLKLGPGTWHAHARPAVEASSEKSGCTLELLREQFGTKDEVLASAPAIGDFMELALENIPILPGANLRAVVKTKTAELAEVSFSFRSAETPRPLARSCIFHAVGQGGFLLEPRPTLDQGSPGLEGCFIHGNIGSPAPSVIQIPTTALAFVPEGNPESLPEVNWQRSSETAREPAESCVIKGYHHWVVEPFEKGDDILDAKMAECKACHVRALSRTREVAKDNRRKSSRIQQAAPIRKRSSLEMAKLLKQQVVSDPIISPDTVFDGLCHLGHGKWAALQRLASAVSAEPWFAHSFAAELFALGHLEAPDPFHSMTTEWSVPPPVLVVGLDSRAFLSGFHSRALVESIDAALVRAGARHEPIIVPGQITVHRWSGLTGLDLVALLSGITDPHGRPVTVAKNIGAVIAGQLPLIGAAWVVAAPMHVEQVEGAARFDAARARWTRVDRVDVPGAYRVGFHGTRYIFRDNRGATRQVGHRVAKILAARAEGVRLHSYDPMTGRFLAALGVEPPGLFARALVASGGMLPTREEGRLVYSNVDPSVAAHVLSKLYGKDRDHG